MKICRRILNICLSAAVLLSGCARSNEEEIVLETIIKTERMTETGSDYTDEISESAEDRSSDIIPDITVYDDFPYDDEIFLTYDISEQTSYTEDTYYETAPLPYSEIFTESEAATVSAQNLLSADGGSVIIENPVTTAAPVTETSPEATYSQSYHALNYKQQSGMWFSYLEYQRILKGHTEAQFTSEIEKAFDNMVSIGINTVYVQIRPFGDSYYFSDYFPMGDLMTKAFDPLEIMVREAHDRGLSIHGWINPLRIQTKGELWALSERFLTKQWYQKKINMFEYEDRYYLDPSSEEVRGLICSGVREILEKYKVDGIQIDDYFYPSADLSLDEKSYKASGSTLTHENFRYASVSKMVKNIYDTVHSTNPTAIFGIAPMGNIEGNKDLFADVRLWCGERGFCDYICPQIYFGFEHEERPYERTLKEWKALCREDISVVIGIGAYRTGTQNTTAGKGKNEWIDNTDVIARQIKTADEYGCGYALFRYDSLFSPDKDVKSYADKEIENMRQLITGG